MTGAWQAEAVLATACLVAAVSLGARSRPPAARWIAAALVGLAVAALLGGLLFADFAPRLGPAHDAASRLFATLGFAIVAVALVGGSGRKAVAGVGALALAGLVIPLAPVVLLAHGVAGWRDRARRARQALALAAMLAVIVGQLVVPAGSARLDTLHLTLAAWTLTLMVALA